MIVFRFIIFCGAVSNHVAMGFEFLQPRLDPGVVNQQNPTLFTIPRHRFKNFQKSHIQLHLLGKDLGNSIKSHQGVLFVQNNDEWNLICGHHWDVRGANVACRQLGFPMGALKATADNYNNKQHTFIYTDVQCFGNETELEECTKVIVENPIRYECENKRVAGVVCRTVEKKCRPKEFRCSYTQCIRVVFLCDGEKDCLNGEDEDPEQCKAPIAMRLIDGPNNASGRVEVRHNGVWGTICDDAWDHKDAQVICRMLGFPDNPTIVAVHANAYFGPGNGIVWLDNVRCTGKETSILDCPKRPWGKNNCGHEEDAGVTCLSRSAIYNNYDIFPRFCGRRLIHQYSDDYKRSIGAGRIVGGHPSMPGNNPWQVGIRLRKQNGAVIHHCGGVIVNEFYILSAAHCFEPFSLHAYVIRVGDFDNQVVDKEEQEFDVDFLIKHEDFGNGALFNNDIALAKIKPQANGSGIRFGLYVQPICLSLEENFYIPGMHCMISGWGKINAHVYSERLQESEVPILPWIKCRHKDVYGPYRFTEKMFCAGYLTGGIDTCQGDSGGPLVCSKKDHFFLFGLVSWGDGCGDVNKPGVYVRVQDYVPWIEQKIRGNQ